MYSSRSVETGDSHTWVRIMLRERSAPDCVQMQEVRKAQLLSRLALTCCPSWVCEEDFMTQRRVVSVRWFI